MIKLPNVDLNNCNINYPLLLLVLAEDAIKSAVNDWQSKRKTRQVATATA